jgi:tRNA uridine 5-carboxymethylaminomethyl modification enzyme
MTLQQGAFLPQPPLDDSDSVLYQQIEEQIEISIKYQGYIERQADEIERHGANENTRLPENFDYAEVRGLSFEARQKLTAVKPETIGQASRISGMTPAAISLLMVHMKRRLGRSSRDDGAETNESDDGLGLPQVLSQ